MAVNGELYISDILKMAGHRAKEKFMTWDTSNTYVVYF